MIRIIQPQNARNGRRRCSIARGAYRSSYCCCCLVGFFFAGLRKIIVIFPERKHLGLARARSPLRLQQHNYHHRIEREIEIVLGNLDDEIYRARVEEIKKKKLKSFTYSFGLVVEEEEPRRDVQAHARDWYYTRPEFNEIITQQKKRKITKQLSTFFFLLRAQSSVRWFFLFFYFSGLRHSFVCISCHLQWTCASGRPTLFCFCSISLSL